MDLYDSFINDDEEGIYNGDPNEEGYQGPPDSPEKDEIIDNSDEERAANSYDRYIGAEVVIPDRQGEELMGKVRKHFIYDDTSTGRGNYNDMHDKYLYEVECVLIKSYVDDSYAGNMANGRLHYGIIFYVNN